MARIALCHPTGLQDVFKMSGQAFAQDGYGEPRGQAEGNVGSTAAKGARAIRNGRAVASLTHLSMTGDTRQAGPCGG